MLLETYRGKYALTKQVYFIGFMGAGKTTVSRFMARTCGLASIDADEYLELLEDRVIADIFAEDGEEHFRDLETAYLEDLSKRKPRLVGCGGGVVKRDENVRIMHEHGFIIYLTVTAEQAAERIPNTDSRPLFKNLDTARIALHDRLPLYENAADAIVETTGRSVADVADEVKHILLEQGILVERDAG